jgi:hypothetical protein
MATSVDDLFGDSALRRAARLAAQREFRPRRIPARLAVALVMVVAGGLTAFAALGRPDAVLRDGLAALRLDDPRVLAAAGALSVAGLALVLLAALPGRTRVEPLRGMDPHVVAGVSRRSLGRALAATAAEVPGIDSVSVRLRGRLRRRAVVRVAAGDHNPGNLAELVRDAVTDRLAEIGPVHAHRVVVRLTWQRD